MKLLLASLILATITACDRNSEELTDVNLLVNGDAGLKSAQQAKNKNLKATGSIEITFKEKDSGHQPENLRGFMDINATQANEINDKEAKGEIHFLVTLEDLTFHREIYATVNDVSIDDLNAKAYIIATVTYDSKECKTEGEHDEHGEEVSDTEIGETEEGHDSESHEDSGEEGSHGSSHVSGKNCRIDQVIIIELEDGGSPGAMNDLIAWKWFQPEDAPTILNWPEKLCNKNIINGNLTVHY